MRWTKPTHLNVSGDPLWKASKTAEISGVHLARRNQSALTNEVSRVLWMDEQASAQGPQALSMIRKLTFS